MFQNARKLKNSISAVALAVLIAAFAMPGFAAAQSTGPTSDQYNPPVVKITGGGGSTGDDTGSGGLGDPVGSLPFTGFDVIAMLAVALAVTGLGLGLGRAVSRQPRSLD